MALLPVLWNEREGCRDPLGACCLQQAQAKGGALGHLPWALSFMKVYPKQGPCCSVVDTSSSTVDQKIHCKWVWAYVKAITKLVDVVGVCFIFLHLFIDLLSTATASKGHCRRWMPLPSTRCCCHMPLPSTIIISRCPPPPRRHLQILFNSKKRGISSTTVS
jgi:hypothetical protein